MNVQVIAQLDTAYSADATEASLAPLLLFLPHLSRTQLASLSSHTQFCGGNLLACGLYQLDKPDASLGDAPARRLGRILLLHVTDAGLAEVWRTDETAAVTDMRWHRLGSMLVTATAGGTVETWHVQDSAARRVHSCAVVDDSNQLALSIDLSSAVHPTLVQQW